MIIPVIIYIYIDTEWDTTIAIFLLIALIVYIPTLLIWRRVTFTRSDFIETVKTKGVRILKRLYYPGTADIFGVYSFAYGYWDNIFIVGKFDIPTFSFSPAPRIAISRSNTVYKVGGYSPEYMKRESQIELFSLIHGPFDININIQIDENMKKIPETKIKEIDSILKDSFENVDDFYARLIFNDECLRMTVTGGSWLGDRFKKRIVKGLEVYKKISDTLNNQYPVKSWDEWEVKWNREDEQFYLQQKV